ncbi:hypothetical protein PCE1_002035 [Barthelona sp. PCE]
MPKLSEVDAHPLLAKIVAAKSFQKNFGILKKPAEEETSVVKEELFTVSGVHNLTENEASAAKRALLYAQTISNRSDEQQLTVDLVSSRLKWISQFFTFVIEYLLFFFQLLGFLYPFYRYWNVPYLYWNIGKMFAVLNFDFLCFGTLSEPRAASSINVIVFTILIIVSVWSIQRFRSIPKTKPTSLAPMLYFKIVKFLVLPVCYHIGRTIQFHTILGYALGGSYLLIILYVVIQHLVAKPVFTDTLNHEAWLLGMECAYATELDPTYFNTRVFCMSPYTYHGRNFWFFDLLNRTLIIVCFFYPDSVLSFVPFLSSLTVSSLYLIRQPLRSMAANTFMLVTTVALLCIFGLYAAAVSGVVSVLLLAPVLTSFMWLFILVVLMIAVICAILTIVPIMRPKTIPSIKSLQRHPHVLKRTMKLALLRLGLTRLVSETAFAPFGLMKKTLMAIDGLYQKAFDFRSPLALPLREATFSILSLLKTCEFAGTAVKDVMEDSSLHLPGGNERIIVHPEFKPSVFEMFDRDLRVMFIALRFVAMITEGRTFLPWYESDSEDVDDSDDIPEELHLSRLKENSYITENPKTIIERALEKQPELMITLEEIADLLGTGSGSTPNTSRRDRLEGIIQYKEQSLMPGWVPQLVINEGPVVELKLPELSEEWWQKRDELRLLEPDMGPRMQRQIQFTSIGSSSRIQRTLSSNQFSPRSMSNHLSPRKYDRAMIEAALQTDVDTDDEEYIAIPPLSVVKDSDASVNAVFSPVIDKNKRGKLPTPNILTPALSNVVNSFNDSARRKILAFSPMSPIPDNDGPFEQGASKLGSNLFSNANQENEVDLEKFYKSTEDLHTFENISSDESIVPLEASGVPEQDDSVPIRNVPAKNTESMRVLSELGIELSPRHNTRMSVRPHSDAVDPLESTQLMSSNYAKQRLRTNSEAQGQLSRNAFVMRDQIMEALNGFYTKPSAARKGKIIRMGEEWIPVLERWEADFLKKTGDMPKYEDIQAIEPWISSFFDVLSFIKSEKINDAPISFNSIPVLMRAHCRTLATESGRLAIIDQ